jgi:hypothetical protein
MSDNTAAHDPSAPFDFAQGRRFAGTSPRMRAGRHHRTHRFSLARPSSKRRSSAQSFFATG